jgi:hypothetical protein
MISTEKDFFYNLFVRKNLASKEKLAQKTAKHASYRVPARFKRRNSV